MRGEKRRQHREEQKVGKEEKVIIQSKPQLQKGINLLQKPGRMPVFQALVAEELRGRSASAVWIDSMNESSTYALSKFGGKEVLEKVRIGRAFTPFQHHRLIHQLEEFVQENTEILVLPNIDFLYLDGQLKEWEAEELFKETWEKILEVREEYGLKLLVSLSSRDSGLSYAVIDDADNKIQVEATQEGWKYDSQDFEQYAYRDGGEVQTTVPYWHQKTSETVKVSVEAV